ncbi:MAG: PepSY domain-containing protein [Faecalicoccus sp.]|uniref:PepSY domain-containing protein n=1 Tax=Faecalicoccus sp. TaxID=1971758 RepID=UPI002A909EFE|nr:PepSY domain-containing protein [Faecalicoccus sp.]MDY5232201.1 PepSY domain-containing protein [Faecalicoccus sp.]
MKKSVILILVLVVVVLIVGVSLFFGLQVNLEKARDIALDRVSDEKAEIIEEKSEKEFLLSEYEFTILTEDALYEITVGSFGDINGFEKEELPKQSTQSTEQNNTQNNTTDIGMQKAQEIALSNHADGTITDADRDVEPNGIFYEIEVTEGLTEYDYTINGNDGTIIRTTQDSVHD